MTLADKIASLPDRRERFMDFVEPVPESGCWLWIGGVSGTDYGRFWNGKRLIGAHRFAYETFRGPIPGLLHIDHLCRVHCCVNPNHMEVVTCKENVLRGIGISAINSRKTHCNRGHELAGDNCKMVKLKYGQKRDCKICRRRMSRDGKRRRKLARAKP